MIDCGVGRQTSNGWRARLVTAQGGVPAGYGWGLESLARMGEDWLEAPGKQARGAGDWLGAFAARGGFAGNARSRSAWGH